MGNRLSFKVEDFALGAAARAAVGVQHGRRTIQRIVRSAFDRVQRGSGAMEVHVFALSAAFVPLRNGARQLIGGHVNETRQLSKVSAV